MVEGERETMELGIGEADENSRPQMFFRDNYPSKKKGLRLIAVSSINSNLEILNTLNKYLIYNDITNNDFVACTGSLANCDDGAGIVANDKVDVASLGTSSSVACALEKIVCSVYYVPGDSDPDVCYGEQGKGPNALRPTETPKLTHSSFNVHSKASLVKESLVLAGVGGKQGQWVRQGGASGNSTGIKLKEIREHVNKECPGVPILLLSHNSPASAPTDSHGKDAALASDAYKDFFAEEDVVLNIAGGCGGGSEQGQTKVSGVPVICPGRLDGGKFAVIDLSRTDDGTGWKLGSVEFKSLF